MPFPRVLIISPEPYHANSSSRCLASFFGSWDEKAVAQFYTTEGLPEKCFCNNYFRLTDFEIAKRNFGGSDPGEIMDANSISKAENQENQSSSSNGMKRALKRHFKKKTPLNHLLRESLWKKKYWDNPKFSQWVDDFSPEAIFLDLGGDNRLSEIALTIAERKKIPVVTFLPDDFFFKIKSAIMPLKRLYFHGYRNSVEKVLSYSSYNIFSCELMKEKYCERFNCKGEVIYFVSSVTPKSTDNPEYLFSFLGSIEYGRWKSLIKIGDALASISKDYHIELYSKVENADVKTTIEKCEGIRLHDPIPYSEVIKVMTNSRFVLHVEDFAPENIACTKYSLSTKIADCLSCGSCTFAFGPACVGSMDYLIKNNCAVVCTEDKDLKSVLDKALNDKEAVEKIKQTALKIAHANHTDNENSLKVLKVFTDAINKKRVGYENMSD